MTADKSPPLPEPIGMIVGRRLTPENTREFFGYFEPEYAGTQKEFVYTADQMQERDAMWLARLAALTDGAEPVAWWNGLTPKDGWPSIGWDGEDTNHDIPIYSTHPPGRVSPMDDELERVRHALSELVGRHGNFCAYAGQPGEAYRAFVTGAQDLWDKARIALGDDRTGAAERIVSITDRAETAERRCAELVAFLKELRDQMTPILREEARKLGYGDQLNPEPGSFLYRINELTGDDRHAG